MHDQAASAEWPIDTTTKATNIMVTVYIIGYSNTVIMQYYNRYLASSLLGIHKQLTA